jgi:hypothetical protein
VGRVRTFAGGALCGAPITAAVVLGINFGYLAFFNLLQNSALVILVKAIAGAVAGGVMAGILGKRVASSAAVVHPSA